MKKLVVLTATLVAYAAAADELNTHAHALPTQAMAHQQARPGGGGASNLTNHGGPTLTKAFVIPIFWGPSWTGADAGLATSIQNYVAAFGQTGEYNVITQYSGIQKSFLNGAGPAIFDTSTPPKNVTDAIIQQEVVNAVGANALRSDTIYEVFLPTTSYASLSSSQTSCGGPALAFCAYHGNFASGTTDVKYGSMPYPSCSGCQSAGFNATQNFEHFISHETREAVTDPDLNAWYDRRGNEADDKCAWSPTPFTDAATGTNADGTAFAYQYEWSNANSACVKTR